MTDDLVQRLREYRIGCGVHCSDYSNREPLEECLEAANRIEQLEEALQGLFDNFLELHAKEGCNCDDCEAVRFARAALGEK